MYSKRANTEMTVMKEKNLYSQILRSRRHTTACRAISRRLRNGQEAGRQ